MELSINDIFAIHFLLTIFKLRELFMARDKLSIIIPHMPIMDKSSSAAIINEGG